MSEEVNQREKEKWIDFLYFAYKKAKHFVTKETSFVNEAEIIQFESNLDNNIRDLAKLLENETKLKQEIENMEGHLYFFPKSFGPNKQPRIRPKVTFPFQYQILWAAVILRIGEWFDTENNLKNVFSMRDENIRAELDWMVPWSFNGRLKRLTTKKRDKIESSYIQYNNSRLYESHQMALRKFNTYELEITEKLFEKNEKIYKAELDIQEFFPTLKKEYIKDMFSNRLDKLKKINCFEGKYFNPDQIKTIIDTLMNLDIIYPETIRDDDPILEVLIEYYYLIRTDKNKSKINSDINKKTVLPELIKVLKDTLPLDLIASNFISNCVLNHFVDSKINVNEKNNTFILRYTDDYAILSSDKEEVIKKIDQIKEQLKNIELTYSNQKTLPTTVKDIEENLKYLCKDKGWSSENYASIQKWFGFEKNENKISIPSNFTSEYWKEIKTKSQMIGINIEPEEKYFENINKDLFTTKLSTAADLKVQALNDEELAMYIEELLVYIKAEGKLGELEEDTVKIFAAWRLNSSHHELLQRETYDVEDIREVLNILEDAIRKYPAKLGFYDVYLLLILRMIESNESGFNELETFLIKIKTLLKATFSKINKNEEERNKANEFLSSCFPSVRIRILNLISSNWKRFDEEKRERLREILEKVFLHWYAEPNIKWDELYVMYTSFFVLRIKLPLGICKEQKKHPKFLSEIANVYNTYNFTTEKYIQGNKDNQSNILEIISGINLLKKGLYWNKDKRAFNFNEVDQKIYNTIKKHLILIKDETLSSESNIFLLYAKLEFAKIAPEKLESKDWCNLINKNIAEQEGNFNEIIFEFFDFLQQCILKYFEKPKKYSAFIKWIDSSKESNIFKMYVKERFNSFGIIRSYFSKTDERLPSLETNEVDKEVKIPIADWVFYCQTLPFHLETASSKQKVLHPLTEYEFVKLLSKIIHFESNDFLNQEETNSDDSKETLKYLLAKSHLFNIKMSPAKWVEFRSHKYIQNENDDNKKENNEDNESNKIFNKEQSEEIVKSLFSLLTNRPWHIHLRRKFSMYKWNDLQSYFEMTYYPSTAVASLFVNYLNAHQDFYSRHYHMPLEELPYREISLLGKSRDIVKWKDEYIREQADNQVYKSDNRKLELLEIDIDQLRS